MTAENKIKNIIKRDGDIVAFDEKRIMDAVYKSTVAIGEPNLNIAEETARKVVDLLNQTFDEDTAPTVEDIQDVVEHVLINEKLTKIAKSYILYRQERAEIRKQKETILGRVDKSKLSPNALLIAKERYLLRDNDRKSTETPIDMFRRVAKAIAASERRYNADKEKIKFWEKKFYNCISQLDFVPAGRIMAGAGTPEGQLLSSFVIPLGDSTKEIFKALYDSSIIKRYGGGVGFSFSKLRAKGSKTSSTTTKASGPVAFMHLFDHSSGLVSSSEHRKGANMGSLSVEHPDIIDFITSKADRSLQNFNISVEITDNFMKALSKNRDYELIDPRTGRVVERTNARKILSLLITMAWKFGDPGMLFIDRINQANPVPALGRFETTDPCGDQPLLSYGAVAYGAINLAHFALENDVDWNKLRALIPLTVRFLDNTLDATRFPITRFKKTVYGLRNVGLGVMGFADLLYELGVPYNSKEAIKLASRIMNFIQTNAHEASRQLAEERGTFPLWKKSAYTKKNQKRRNATITTIAPCGARSILADTSGGIEPHFGLCYYRRTVATGEIMHINPIFEKAAKQNGFYSTELMRDTASQGGIKGIEEIPAEIKKVFVTAHDITPEWHIRIQAAFQEHTDNAISKTINFPYQATIKDVEEAFLLAYKLGCKGLTVYRDGSRDDQVLYTY